MSRYWRAIVLAVAVSAAAMTSWSISQEKPAPPAAGKQPAELSTPKTTAAAEVATAEQAILQKLEQPTDLVFSETPLREVLERISQKHKLQILPDPKRLEDANVALDAPVTRSLKGLKLRQALNVVLRDLGLAWVIRDEVLEITSREAADTFLVIRTYPVGDLVRLRGKVRDDQRAKDGLGGVIRDVIAADSWANAGGPGTLELARSVMVVSQTLEKHAAIARLLAVLRQTRHQVTELKGEARLAIIDADDENATIHAKMRRNVSIDWAEKPLKECASALEAEHGFAVEVSQKKVEAAGKTLDTPLTARLSSVSLGAALDRATRPHGLGWMVRDGVLLITTLEHVDTHLTTRVYPIPDLLPRDDAAEESDSMVELLTNTVRSDSWQDAGGPGQVIPCDGLACLICVQTCEVHAEIEKLLASLRRDGAASAAAAPARPMVLHIYKIGPTAAPTAQPAGAAKTAASANVAAEDVAKIVRELVAPESWQASDGKAYLRPLGDRLIVRQTPKVHREITILLDKLGLLSGGWAGRGRRVLLTLRLPASTA